MFLKIVIASFISTRIYAGVSFEPESGEIDIIEGENYDMTFFTNNVTHCYYNSSNPKIQGDFPVEDCETKTDLNGISKIGQHGSYCGISITDADDTLPGKWTITVVYKDYMNPDLVYNATKDVTVNFYYRVSTSFDPIKAFPSSTYYQYLLSEDITVKSCMLVINNIALTLDVNSEKVTFPETTEDPTHLKSRISSFGNGKCGYTMTAHESDSEQRTFFMTDDKNKVYKKYVSVNMYDAGLLYTNTSQEVILGEPVQIPCSFSNKERYCRLYNPSGAMVTEGVKECSHSKKYVTIEDFGDWKCEVGHEYGMKPYILVSSIKRKDPIDDVKILVTADEQDDSITIFCKVRNKSISLNYCTLTRPDREVFVVQSGFETDRYKTVSTDLDEGICALQISKPLQDSEIGSWLCTMATVPAKAVGGYVNVQKQSDESIESPSSIVASVGDSIDIKCKLAPYFSDYCFIVSPQGVRHEINDVRINIGECSLRVTLSKEDSGFWSCFFARQDGETDIKVSVEVIIPELDLISTNAEVEEGESAELICNSELPLGLCNFITPLGVSYHLKKPSSLSKPYSYVGRGLEYGDCGIKISKTSSNDEGKWSCSVTLMHDHTQRVSENLHLRVRANEGGTDVATSLGIAIGVSAVVVIIGVFVFQKWRQRRRANATVDHPRESNSSGDVIMDNVQSYSAVN